MPRIGRSILLVICFGASCAEAAPPIEELRPSVRAALESELPSVALISLLRSFAPGRDRMDGAAAEVRRVVARFRSRAAGSDGLAQNVALYRDLNSFFAHHGLDCNERVLVHLDAARLAAIPLPSYARALDHAGLWFETERVVLDPYDGRVRTLDEFARGGARGVSYYVRTPSMHCLVDHSTGTCRTLFPAEGSDPVQAGEPLASLLLDAAVSNGDRTLAVQLAGIALEIDPRNVDACDLIAGIAADASQWTVAQHDYALAVAFNPNDARVRFNIAVFFHACGELRSAEISYRAALDVQPGMLAATENLAGLVAEDPARNAEAERLARDALSRESSPAILAKLQALLTTLNRDRERVAREELPRETPTMTADRFPSGGGRNADPP